MAYGSFDDTKPAGADIGTAVPGEVLQNCNSLRDMVAMGQAHGMAMTVAGGTAEEPAQLLFKKGSGAGAHWLYANITWSSGRITAISWDKSTNGGSTWDTAFLSQTFSYDGNGNITSATNAGGIVAFLLYLLGKVKSILTTLTTHTGTTGTGVHGLGGMSTQPASAVAITGGTIDGVALGYTYARGKVVNLGNMTGTVNVDWSAGDIFVGTVTGNTTLTETNRPGNAGLTLPGGSLTLRLTNPGAFTFAWPAAWKWPAGVAPTRTVSGLDLYEAFCDDGTTVHAAQAQRDSR